MVYKIMVTSLMSMIFINSYTMNQPNQESLLGEYEHFKTHNNYQVIAIARYSENPHEEFVVYKQLYDSVLKPDNKVLPQGTVWIRPKTMFFETVKNNQGQEVPRFKKIG